MKRITLLICGLAVSAILFNGRAVANPGRPDGWPPAYPSIIGTWQVEVTVRADAADCSTSPPVTFGLNPFPSLNTFHAGGTMSETGSRSPPATRSPGHGVWQPSGKDTYDSRYTFQGFDASGIQVTNMDIRSAITVAPDGNTFQGLSRLQFSIIGGITVPFCATLEGVRFTL